MTRRVLILCSASLCGLHGQGVRYLRWQQIQPLTVNIANTGERMPDFGSAGAWDTWIRQRDWELRGRTDQAVEDLISGWITFGTSFTTQPVLASRKDAVTPPGELTATARARVQDFIKGLDTRDDERWHDVFQFVTRLRVTEEELPAFLGGILRRSALDHASMLSSTEVAPLLTDFAVSETMRALKNSGAMPPHVRRVAVVGPELDFYGGPDGYDFYPLQAVQPFAIMEALQRLDLVHAGEVQLTAMDMNPFVLSHLRALAAKVRTGHYVLQLPLNTAAGWNAEGMSYWSRFGELIASPAEPVPVPAGLHHVNVRAVAVKPQAGARISVNDLDIVAQAVESAPGQAFDVVVALKKLAEYDRVEQSLALASIAEMMNPGAVLLVSGASPLSVPPELQPLGAHRIVYSERGLGIEITCYRRK
ncbi:MAG TPA: hypothetical protein VKX49_27865 [Bryobacteraceae bacterium]|nr:hypothetical protein [Bryobacteraceae bacterium]